jgi:hypothetical protein
MPTPERDAAAARLALPPLTVAPSPGDGESLMAVAKVYGSGVALSPDPIAADRAEREAAAETLEAEAIPYLLVTLPDDWEGIGDVGRVHLAAMSAAVENARRAPGSSGPLDGAAILAGKRATEAICMACVIGAVYVNPNDPAQEEIEHFRLHRGPPGGGNRPVATIPDMVQSAVVAEVQKHLNSFRLNTRRFGRA